MKPPPDADSCVCECSRAAGEYLWTVQGFTIFVYKWNSIPLSWHSLELQKYEPWTCVDYGVNIKRHQWQTVITNDGLPTNPERLWLFCSTLINAEYKMYIIQHAREELWKTRMAINDYFSQSICIIIIQSINRLACQISFKKNRTNVRNVHHNFSEPKMTSSNCFLCQSKLNNSVFAIKYDKEMH